MAVPSAAVVRPAGAGAREGEAEKPAEVIHVPERAERPGTEVGTGKRNFAAELKAIAEKDDPGAIKTEADEREGDSVARLVYQERANRGMPWLMAKLVKLGIIPESEAVDLYRVSIARIDRGAKSNSDLSPRETILQVFLEEVGLRMKMTGFPEVGKPERERRNMRRFIETALEAFLVRSAEVETVETLNNFRDDLVALGKFQDEKKWPRGGGWETAAGVMGGFGRLSKSQQERVLYGIGKQWGRSETVTVAEFFGGVYQSLKKLESEIKPT